MLHLYNDLKFTLYAPKCFDLEFHPGEAGSTDIIHEMSTSNPHCTDEKTETHRGLLITELLNIKLGIIPRSDPQLKIF
jgi:hypothetical protein